ncbi:MAG: cytochrome P460 family protein [Desulfopila sp.]
MKKKLQLSLIFTVSLGISSLAVAEKPGPDAEALWQHIQDTSPYTTWGFWPDHKGLQEGDAPHGPLHKVYVNDIGLASAHAPVDNGSIIVKENIGNDKELKALTVMYKIKGYNPEAGDWYWVKYGTDGSVAKAGKPAGCIGCHGSAADNDYVMVHSFE